MSFFDNVVPSLKSIRFWTAVVAIVIAVIGAGSAADKAFTKRDEWHYTSGIITPLLVALGFMFKRNVLYVIAFGNFFYLTAGVPGASQGNRYVSVGGSFVRGPNAGYAAEARWARDVVNNGNGSIKSDAEQVLSGLILLILSQVLAFAALAPVKKFLRRQVIFSKKSLFGWVTAGLFFVSAFVNYDNVARQQNDPNLRQNSGGELFFEAVSATIVGFAVLGGAVGRAYGSLNAGAIATGFLQTALLSRAVKEDNITLDDATASAGALGWIAVIIFWLFCFFFMKNEDPTRTPSAIRDVMRKHQANAKADLESGSSSSAEAGGSFSGSFSGSGSSSASGSGSSSASSSG